MKEIKYKIGDKIYIQRKLVLGQVRQLIKHLAGLEFPADMRFDFVGLLDVLGDKLPGAFAIVLTEEGQHPRDKDVNTLADELNFGIDAEMALKAIDDFFVLNPTSLILKSLSGMIAGIEKKMAGTQTSSTNAASSLPEET
jgi:hypothetical protein